MNKNVMIVIVIVAILLIGGSLLMQKNKTASSTSSVSDTTSPTSSVSTETPTTAAMDSASPTTAIQAGSVKEFTVTGSNFKFEPATLTVNKGDTVKVIFKNQAGSHDFIIDELNVHSNIIQGGQEDTVQFTADKTGQFEFYCGVGNHRQMGMKGTITVQ